jgi:hypothetical protein
MSESQNLYRCGPRQVREFVTECLYAGLVPFVQSSPGMGKSTIMRNIAAELNLKLVDHRLSTSEPTDLSGLPEFRDGKASFAPFKELFPTEDLALPKGKDGWFIFLDEFNAAPKAVQAASYKLILDRMVGQHKLHENVVIAAAGNLMSDRAIVNPISTAMQSRVIHIEMEINHQHWMEDVAFVENYDSRIIAYLSQYPSKLMDFKPDHNEKTFACPRTWEFMNRLIIDKPVSDEKAPLYAGTITSGIAVDFIQFTKVFGRLVTIRDILADPDNCRLPNDMSERWATIAHIMEKIDGKNLDAISTYTNRFPLDFKVLFWRSTLVRKPELREHPAFGKAMIELVRYLKD